MLISTEEKERLSQQLFGEPLDAPPRPPSWGVQRDQRWHALLHGKELSTPPYKWPGHALIRLADYYEKRGHDSLHTPIKEAKGRAVSDFSNWVLRLYIPEKNPIALQQGIDGERAIVDHRSKLHKAKLEIPRWEFNGWKLEHDGIRGEFDGAFEISDLTIGGETLLGVPDLVFRERRTNRVAIVELKVSPAHLPSDGWPNLRAQLWAYSRIDKWKNAPEIILAGEVWSPISIYSSLARRATYRWVKGDSAFESECSALFKKYGGEIVD